MTLAYYYLSSANNPTNPPTTIVGPSYKDKNSPDTIPIGLAAPALVDPSPVDVTFEFDVASGLPLAPVTVQNVAFDPSKMYYPVQTLDLANKLLSAATGLYSPSSTTPPSIKTTKITLTAATPPANPTGKDKDPLPGVVFLSGTTDNQLTITFKYYLGTPTGGTNSSGQATGSGQAGGSGQAAPAPAGEGVPDPQVPHAGANTRHRPISLPTGVSRSSSLNPATSSLPAPSPSARRDDRTLKTALQNPAPTPAPVAVPFPVIPSTTLTPANLAADLNFGNAAGLPALPPQTAALVNALAARKAGVPTVVAVPPSAPIVNVQVPVNNMMNPKAEHFSLFHRRNKQNATPQNPTRPSLMERLRGNP